MGPDGQERAQIDEHVLGRARDEKQQKQKELHVCLVPQKWYFARTEASMALAPAARTQ